MHPGHYLLLHGPHATFTHVKRYLLVQEHKMEELQHDCDEMRQDLEIAAAEIMEMQNKQRQPFRADTQLSRTEREELNVFRAMHVEEVFEENKQLIESMLELKKQVEFAKHQHQKLEHERNWVEESRYVSTRLQLLACSVGLQTHALA